MHYGWTGVLLLVAIVNSYGTEPNRYQNNIALQITLCQSSPENVQRTQQMLKRDGYTVFNTSEQLSVQLTPKELFKLFHAKIHLEKQEANSFNGTITVPVLYGTRISGKYKKLVCNVDYDPQLD